MCSESEGTTKIKLQRKGECEGVSEGNHGMKWIVRADSQRAEQVWSESEVKSDHQWERGGKSEDQKRSSVDYS